VGAHLPVGEEIAAFQFPAELEPAIDGDLSDWELVPPRYRLSASQFTDLVADAAEDPDDFALWAALGWCSSTNRLYVAAEVRDDVHQVDRPDGTAASLIWQDDDMEIMVDADHSGGQYARFDDLPQAEALARNGAAASHFLLAGPHRDGDFFVNLSAAAWYALPAGPHTAAAVAHSGGTTRYEVSLTPFDEVNMVADFLSVPHAMAEGETLGLNLEFRDFDANSEVWEAVWSLSGGQNAFFLSERFADVRLASLEEPFLPTSVRSRAWGQIKASFGE